MEGAVFHESTTGDGIFTRERPPWNMPTGFSALDLYAMGMLAPEEVPDTYLIDDPKRVGPNQLRGKKVRIRIQDVIAAMGPRVPDYEHAQKSFTLGVYLLYEGGRKPDAAKLRQSEAMEKALIEYLEVATGGRMHVSASRP
jgi:hypothetical protein